MSRESRYRVHCTPLLRIMGGLSVVALIGGLSAATANGQIQWPPEGVPIRQGDHTLWQRSAVSANTGGTILLWRDSRSGYPTLYAQRVDSLGNSIWTPGGVLVHEGLGFPDEFCISRDSSGGAIVCWHDLRSDAAGDIYAQRVSDQGEVLWATAGVPISTAPDAQKNIAIVPDGTGGAIITWQDNRYGGHFDIYAQKIDENGIVQWLENGVMICGAVDDQHDPEIVEDGSGGAIVTWMDRRDPMYQQVYSQKVDSAGNVQWTTNGAPACSVMAEQWYPCTAPDDSGGVIIIWYDNRSGMSRVYAQRLDTEGLQQWTREGIAASTGTVKAVQFTQGIVADDIGGSIIIWEQWHISGQNLYAQRISKNGALEWPGEGVPIYEGESDLQTSAISADGCGGAIISWIFRPCASDTTLIRAQRISREGSPLWTPNGSNLSTMPGPKCRPVIVTDTVGAAILWSDRPGARANIYGQSISSDGQLLWGEAGKSLVAGLLENGYLHSIASDSFGGAIIGWYDKRTRDGCDIYVQRVNSDGIVQWETDGVPVCSSAIVNQSLPSVTGDGSGGAIVVWKQQDIRIQRIGSDGIELWAPEGIILTTTPGYTERIGITSDGEGGAIVAWTDRRFGGGSNSYIYAQKVDSSGTVRWTEGGVQLNNVTDGQLHPALIPDGEGGAIIGWLNDDSNVSGDIYVQRVDANGVTLWGGGAVAICTVRVMNREPPAVVPDFSGGAILLWSDDRGGSQNVYAQRVNANGVPQWQEDGLRIASGYGLSSAIVSDEAGGAIIQFGRGSDIYAQRIDSDGHVLWDTSGVLICSASGAYFDAAVVTDQANGAIVVWRDGRDGEDNLYGQRVDSSGAVQWAPDGIPVCVALRTQEYPVITTDGLGGAITAWSDRRGEGTDIYVQRLNDGHIGVEGRGIRPTPSSDLLIGNYPNPIRNGTLICYQTSQKGPVSLQIYSAIGQLVRRLVNNRKPPGHHVVYWDVKDNNGRKVANGVYFCRMNTDDYASTRKLVVLR